MFGTMESYIQRQQREQRVLLASSLSSSPSMDYKPPPMEDEEEHDDHVGHDVAGEHRALLVGPDLADLLNLL